MRGLLFSAVSERLNERASVWVAAKDRSVDAVEGVETPWCWAPSYCLAICSDGSPFATGGRNLLAFTRGKGEVERKTGFEPATLSLARRCSTTEPLPLGTLEL